jgi:tetrathionate reductase subunit B
MSEEQTSTPPGVSRRQFMKVAGTLLGGAIATSIALEPGKSLIEGLAAKPVVANDPNAPYWGFVVDIEKCIGCGRCVAACKAENNVPPLPECNRTWVERYRVMADGEMAVDSPEGGINGFGKEHTAEELATLGPEGRQLPLLPSQPDLPLEEDLVREEDVVRSFFVPKLCNQCENAPCVQVCPVSATFKTAEGVVLVDQSRCIGCRYCIQACPYGGRYLVPNVKTTPTGQINVADKCTWCYHRITQGRDPACVEVCPVGARTFGDLNDPESHVSAVLRERQTAVLKPDLGTKPRVYYLGMTEGVR